MAHKMKYAVLCLRWVLVLVVGILLMGCAGITPTETAVPVVISPTNHVAGGTAVLRPNDLVSIAFSGVGPKNFDARIKEDGTILPPTIDKDGPVTAAGLTSAELEGELQKRYAKYFKNLTVTVLTEGRFFFVDGEVRSPSRFPYSGELKLTQAIAVAQGFTDFASKGQILITRANGEKHVVDYKKALKKPALDLPVYPGDHILVPRRIM